MKLQGKTIVVTGAARGIGQEYAVALATEGASIVACDVSDCTETVQRVEAAGGQVLALKVDVADAASTQAMAGQAIERFGRIDGLINNAALYGQLKSSKFEQIPESEWDAAMTVNVKGIWNASKAVVPAMREAGGGSIVNITSLAATYGMPFRLHYTTSKAAVIGMTRGMARELGKDLIRVNAVAPAAVMTEGTQAFFAGKVEKALDAIKGSQAIQRNLVPADLAGTILYLVSDASCFVTGQTLSVDGGTVMH
ncbi:SDR family oxidoreductase [Variovorax defluvii]|uniref:SDR family oxidoreductase n=1 Tax=Variovorax defluvii TaxID=913761 RepID=A0ABP8HET8_9BURK